VPGTASSCTLLFEDWKVALQIWPQLIPPGVDVTVPVARHP
jgi:hypothetical protein